jgi:AcrR family transcriptional regulator
MAHRPVVAVENDLSGTKLSLILAAGELFAEKGYDGVGIRAIADRAGANIAAVNYHFGNKEQLYREVLRFVMRDVEEARTEDFLERAEACESPQEFADLLGEMVHARFAAYFSPRQPLWHGRLVIRSFLEPSPTLQRVVKEDLTPDQEALRSVIRLAQPELDEQEVELYAYSVAAEVAFYIFARNPILMSRDQSDYERGFLLAAARHVARMLTVSLGLPEPSRARRSN